jgi:hypothetical protein
VRKKEHDAEEQRRAERKRLARRRHEEEADARTTLNRGHRPTVLPVSKVFLPSQDSSCFRVGGVPAAVNRWLVSLMSFILPHGMKAA